PLHGLITLVDRPPLRTQKLIQFIPIPEYPRTIIILHQVLQTLPSSTDIWSRLLIGEGRRLSLLLKQGLLQGKQLIRPLLLFLSRVFTFDAADYGAACSNRCGDCCCHVSSEISPSTIDRTSGSYIFK